MHFSPMDPESGLVSTLSVRLLVREVKRGVGKWQRRGTPLRCETDSLPRIIHPAKPSS